MERAVRENEYVLIMCTPRYKKKSDERVGGVGYEGDIMTAEVLSTRNHRKFIPVLCEGTWENSLPSWLSGKYGVDLRGDRYSEDQYLDLINTLLGTREQAPAISSPPQRSASKPTPTQPSPESQFVFEPIRILGVVIDEVGRPRNDGTRGCALYEVPFRLSADPPSEWAHLFVEAWNHPPQFTTMHRPGIASVVGPRLILDGTTIDEVERVHRPTLKLALEIANEKYSTMVIAQQQAEQEERERMEKHSREVREIADRLDFD